MREYDAVRSCVYKTQEARVTLLYRALQISCVHPYFDIRTLSMNKFLINKIEPQHLRVHFKGQNQVILDITTEKRCLVQVAILFMRNEDISKLLQSTWYRI